MGREDLCQRSLDALTIEAPMFERSREARAPMQKERGRCEPNGMGALIFGEQRIQYLTWHLALGSRETQRNALTKVGQWGAGPFPHVVSSS
jgi:hypothetical protein